MTKLEYHKETMGTNPTEQLAIMNQVGQAGWDLCWAYNDPINFGQIHMFFKKPIEEVAPNATAQKTTAKR